jgi:hypothetical protein
MLDLRRRAHRRLDRIANRIWPRPALKAQYFYIAGCDHPNDRVYWENLKEFFDSIGAATRQIMLKNEGGQRPELLQCIEGDAIAVIGHNWHLDHSWIGGTPFLVRAALDGIPVIQWFHDHPSAIWPRLMHTTAKNSRFLFQSAYSERYFRRFILPMCASGWTAGTGATQYSRIAECGRDDYMGRAIKCVLPLNLRRSGGTLADAEQRLENLPGELCAAATAAIESAYHDLLAPIETHFFDDAPPPQLLDTPDLFHHCIQIIEEIVQIKRRLEVFAVAAEFPVLIQSDITPPAVTDKGVATVDLGVSMTETATRFKDARAVVSLSHVNDEVHNRTLNALNAGAVNIVEDNAAHRRFFTHGVNALLFTYGDNSLHEALDLVCSRPDRAYEIAKAAMALRDDPGLKFGGFNNFVTLAG